MKKFNEFKLKPVVNGFVGEKIDINRILNKEIIVEKYKVEDSKFTDKAYKKCLNLQIIVDGTQRVVFIGARVLIETISQLEEDDFPFKTTIVRMNNYFEFT